jgi:hypothetical protein
MARVVMRVTYHANVVESDGRATEYTDTATLYKESRWIAAEDNLFLIKNYHEMTDLPTRELVPRDGISDDMTETLWDITRQIDKTDGSPHHVMFTCLSFGPMVSGYGVLTEVHDNLIKLQRLWRHRQNRPRRLAVAMGRHARLAPESPLRLLDTELIDMILACVSLSD